MSDIKSVLITGANAGLGLEAARQLASHEGVQKIYLACRNRAKANEAKSHLEAGTGRSIFEIVLVDVMNLDSIRDAVAQLNHPIDAVVLNAGGTGGATPFALTSEGVTHMFAVNVLGHAVLVDAMIEKGLINSVVLYAGSEAARGIPRMGIARPELKSASVQEFASIADGSKYSNQRDPLAIYGEVKLVATLWMASMARHHPKIRFVTMSPGGTTGTNGMDDLPFAKKVLFKYIGGTLMPLFGMMHGIRVGAKRYVDALMNSRFESGRFYASKGAFPTGPVVDQSSLYDGFGESSIQDEAYQAIHQFVPKQTGASTEQTTDPVGSRTSTQRGVSRESVEIPVALR